MSNIIFEHAKPFYTSGGKDVGRIPKKCGCNNNCKCNKSPQGCFQISLDDTIDILAKINYKISTLSEKIHNNIAYKYPLTNEKSNIDKLIIYRDSLLRYQKRLITSSELCKTCKVDNKIQSIFEGAKHLLGVGYSLEKQLHYTLTKNIPELEDGLYVDETNLNSWLSKNPYCAPVDLWEKLAYHVCGKLDIDIQVEEIKCNLTFDIIKESISLDVLAGLSIGKYNKGKGILNKRTSDECKLDWELLIEKVDCDLDYTLYLELIRECNLTYDVITEAYSCGLSFVTENNQHYLKGKNFSYNLSEINFKSPITSYEDLLIEGIKLTSEHSLDKAKLEKLLSDYNLTEKQLRKLK